MIAVIGPGRMGQGLALAITRRGQPVVLLGRRHRSVAASLHLHTGAWPAPVRNAEVVIIATPDHAVSDVAARLAEGRMVSAAQVVLHLSGLLDRTALAPLEDSGAALGSFHPLQTIADPATAPARLEGAYAGVEGDPFAVDAAERIATLVGMTPFRLPPGAKPAYHAAAAIVANYTGALLGVAERVAGTAGIPPALAAAIYLPLLRGTVDNLSTMGPAAALTGPVRRGDSRTLEAHLAALSPADRALYRQLALAALELGRTAGLDDEAAAEVERVLRRR